MNPAKHTAVEHPSGDESTCCLAHGSAGTFICAVHTMLYLMGKVVVTVTSTVALLLMVLNLCSDVAC